MVAMREGLILVVLLHVITTHPEHSPFHQREGNSLIDVEDTRVRFSSVSNRLDGTVKLSANVSKIQDAETVLFSWVNKDAGPYDMIALYTPPSRPVSDYLDYRFTVETDSWSKTDGSFHETLFNMRGDYVARYLTVDAQKKATVRATILIQVETNEPLHGHIAVTENPGEIRVMWGGVYNEGTRVRYSTNPDLSDAVTVPTETATTYSAEDLCGPRANRTSPIMFQSPGYFYSSVLSSLKPGVKYYYVFGTDKMESPIAAFIGPPLPQTKVYETRFLGFGDMGAYYPPYHGDSIGAIAVTRGLERDVKESRADFILHFGDISYARGRGYIWDQFMSQMRKVSTQVPYMVGVGNHEYDHVVGGDKDPSGAQDEGFHPDWGNYGDDGGGECGVPTMHRYISPDNGNKVFWYSFDYGLVHVVQFSSEHDYRPGSRQFVWLSNDLKSVDRSRTPWVVVTSHRAIYTTNEQKGDHIVSRHMRMCLEELFYETKVNLHLSGHYHNYESTCSVVSGDCASPGTVYVVVGTAGKALDPQEYSPYPWSKHKDNIHFGYERITANTTHMQVEFVIEPEHRVTDNIIIPLWK